MKLFLYSLATAALAISLNSCATSGDAGVRKYRSYDRPATLPSNPNKVRVKVSTKKQLVYVMEGDKPLLIMPVSVGTRKTPTPPGRFRIYSKQSRRRAQTHGYAILRSGHIGSWSQYRPAPWGSTKIGTPMPYWTEFKSGYGFHTGWLKPYPCTHGCIRLHENLAPKFFRLVKVGTPVHIASTQPEDKTIGRNIKRPINADPLPNYPIEMRMGNKIYTHHKKPSFEKP